MKEKTIKILLIEDNPDDAELIKRRLFRSVNARFAVTVAKTLHDGMEQLGQNAPDLVLADLGLPDSHGLDTVTRLLVEMPHIPLVVLSGFDDEAIAIKAVQSGAQDYLVKGKLEDSHMERPLFYAIERARLQRELKQHDQEILSIQTNLLKILEKNADAIIVVGKGRRVLFTNPAVETLLGRRKKELINRPFDFPLDGGRTTEIEITRPDNARTTAEMRVVDITWEGKPAYLASLRNITEHKRSEEALRESEEKFSRAFRSSPEVIVISRLSDGTMLEVNDTFLRVTGYTREELTNKKTTELGIWAKPEERIGMVKTLKEKGAVRDEEYTFRMKSGELRTWLFSAEIVNINNEPCILSVTTDITERKKTEEALRFSDAAFKSIHESVIATDATFTITHWNDISTQIYGIEASRAIGRKLLDVIEIVETHPGENERRLKTIEANGYFQEEQLHRTKHGEVWVDVRLQAIQDGHKRYGWVSLATAVTQRRLAEEALKRSEEKYRELISTSIDGIVSIDSQMRVIIWNQGAEKIYGYKEKEMLGQSLMKIIPEKTRKDVAREFSQINKIGSSKVINKLLVTVGLRKDGTEVPLELSASTRKSEENHLITIIVRDITERKEAELFESPVLTKSGEERTIAWHNTILTDDTGNIIGHLSSGEDITDQKQSQELLQTISNSSPLGIYILQDDKLQYTNPQFQKITGYSQQELADRELLSLIFLEDSDVVKSSTVFTLQQESPYPCEYRILNKNGQIKWVMQTVSPIHYEGREAILDNLMDITERKYLERKVIEYEELSKMKSDLLSTVSHELRTPLATIKGYSTLIIDYFSRLSSDETRDYLKSIDSSTDRLAKLVDNLLDTSRMEAGLLRLEKKPTIITQLIKGAATEARIRADQYHIAVTLVKRLPRVNIDAKRIRQVLDNLIDNAIKYSPPGTEILITANKTGNELLISVADQGPGIPAGELNNIFERMYRIEQRLYSGADGIGLGLYICQRLVQGHGGRIWAESASGNGSTFKFTLPITGKTNEGKRSAGSSGCTP